MSTIGNVRTAATVAISWVDPRSMAWKTLSGRVSWFVVRSLAYRNSFHEYSHTNSEATAMPPAATGKTTRNRVPIREAPSICAASSRSTGMVSKVPTRIHAMKGNDPMRWARIKPM